MADAGFFDPHFIGDIGVIQLFLNLAFGIGMIRPERRIGLWAAVTLWLSAHAIFPSSLNVSVPSGTGTTLSASFSISIPS